MVTVALIPYFGGDSVAAMSKKDNRLTYLNKTIKSVRKLTNEIYVGVYPGENLETLPDNIAVVVMDCAPEYIPANLCRYAQAKLKADFFYVTEADQVLHFNPKILKVVNKKAYLVPHRLEQLGQNNEGYERGPVVDFNRKKFVLPNGNPEGNDFYSPSHPVSSYGGAFICSSELFHEVPFVDANELRVERVTGLDIFNHGQALKSSNWRHFFVEHLSGYEYHERIGGR